MKKFKIKNRRKRKYVKKNDTAYSFSPTQTLTIGLVPLVLMAIAFVTTAVMYSPVLASVHLPSIKFAVPTITIPTLPEFSLPKISKITVPVPQLPEVPEVKFSQPELPKVSLPEAPKVALPRITVPNPIPFIASFAAVVFQTLAQAIQAIFEGIVTVLSLIWNGVVRFVTFTATNIVLTLTTIFQFLVQMILTVGNAIVRGFQWLVATIQLIESMIRQATIQTMNVVGAWTQSTIAVSIKAWNAFVWWLGTPFRAIGKATNDFLILISPVTDYLGQSMEHASEDFSMGGDTLIQGMNYFAEQVDENNAKRK